MISGIADRDILLVSNPVSTQADLNREVIGHFNDLVGSRQCREIPTVGPEYEENVEYIARHIGAGVLVVALGGDGQANIVANAVIAASEESAEIASSVDLLVVPTGRTNDWSLSMYGQNLAKRRNLKRHLERAQSQSLTTIRVEALADGHRSVRDAVGYFSVGASATIARQYGQSAYREGRFKSGILNDMRDGLTMVRAFREHQAFVYEDGAEPGSRALAHELVWSAINRFGKVMRWDVDPQGPGIVGTEYGPGRLLPQVAGRVVSRGFYGGVMGTGMRGEPLNEERIFTISPDTQTSSPLVHAQYDGEAEVVFPRTTFTVSERHKALSTLLVPKAA